MEDFYQTREMQPEVIQVFLRQAKTIKPRLLRGSVIGHTFLYYSNVVYS